MPTALLQSTLDPTKIAEHGLAILFQSLNQGRTVCFVGSGVSMAYGRLSWRELVLILDKEVRHPPEPGADADNSRPQVSAATSTQKALLDALSIGSRSPGDDLKSGRYPTAFQYLEMLRKAMASDGIVQPTLRERVRALLFDDRGQVYSLLSAMLKDLEASDADGRAKRFAFGADNASASATGQHTRNEAERRSPYIAETLFVLNHTELSGWRLPFQSADSLESKGAFGLLSAVHDWAKTTNPDGKCALSPLQRFVLTSIWRLRPVAEVIESLANVEKSASDRTQRALSPRAEVDPLMVVARDLHVSRFLTTNYDLDLERLMADRGFRIVSGAAGLAGASRTISKTGLGATAADTVFDPHRAAELIEFAVAPTHRSLQVMHLHGRATADSDMVITEQDYLEQYLGNGGQAEVVTDALDLAFGANTVLFIGSGMGEDDVLRPLRQFVSERRSRHDRAAVVLLPAMGSHAHQIEEAVALYARYGVHTVHYGIGPWGPGLPKFRWLATLLHLVKFLEDIFKKVEKALPQVGFATGSGAIANQAGGASALTRSLFSAVEEFDLFLHAGAIRDEDKEAARKGFIDLGDSGRAPRVKMPDHEYGRRFYSSNPPLLSLELATLSQTIDFASNLGMAVANVEISRAWLARDKNGAKSNLEQPKVARPALEGQQENPRRVIMAHLALLDGMGNSLVATALCLELQDIHRRWGAFRLHAQVLPFSRPTGGWEGPVKPELPVDRRGSERLSSQKTYPQRRSLGKSRPVTHQKFDAEILLRARHPVALRSLEHEAKQGPAKQPPQSGHEFAPVTDRFFGAAPSLTFLRWYQAIQTASTPTRAAPSDRRPTQSAPSARPRIPPSGLATPHELAGRRVFVLLAPRGVGKGHFFEASKTDRRTGEFIRFSWPMVKSVKDAAIYVGFAFFNLSFSLEVSSAFDRLAAILLDSAKDVFPNLSGDRKTATDNRNQPPSTQAMEIANTYRALRGNRVAQLHELLRLYAQHREHAKTRLFVAISGFNMLFDERGFPKNAQFHRIVTALLGKSTDLAPIDFVLVCTENSFPMLFCKLDPNKPKLENEQLNGWGEMEPLRLEHLGLEAEKPKHKSALEAMVQRMSVFATTEPAGSVVTGSRRTETSPIDTSTTQAPTTGAAAALHKGSLYFFHVLREARASNTVAKYFPDVALALALTAGHWSAQPISSGEGDEVHRVHFPQATVALREIQTTIRTLAQDYSRAERLIATIPAALENLAASLRNAKSEQLATAECKQFGDWVWSAFKNADEAFNPAGQALPSVLDADFRAIANLTCRNRFLLSLTCAVASELAWSGRGARAPGAVDDVSATMAVIQVRNWFVKLRTNLFNHSGADREDRIIGMALDEFHHLHETHAVPLMWKSNPSSEAEHTLEQRLSTQLGWELQQRLMWHLALIGHPVEADVLANAPMVLEIALKLLIPQADGSNKKPTDESLQRVEELVVLCLDLMVRRCLVFRLTGVNVVSSEVLETGQLRDPLGGSPKSKLGKRGAWRFALHRFMQRAIFIRLQSPFVEQSNVDQFGLSMWVTQPDDLPRPNRYAVEEIDTLLAAWSGAPTSALSWEEPWQFRSARERAFANPSADTTLPARMLHAAFGIVRSVFSVGVISRFHDFEVGIARNVGEGYFEQHRQKVALLLQRAVSLRDLQGDLNATAPFYAEEIVWLYNECGLFYLVEGRLDLAAEQFELALAAAASTLEPRGVQGALWCRIHLNLAVVDIERGRLREARQYLVEIRDVADENPILRVLAHGYVAVVEHYSGNLNAAETIYIKVIADLDHFGQSRSVAIFSRHLADLYRARGAMDADKAYQTIDRAIAAATKGGHEDVRQMAKLSRVRLVISRMAIRATEDVQASLDEIERYGQIMGMPRMLADVAYARAAHLLQLGETRFAATLARTAITIASTNSLRLRQMTAMALLGRIYQRRGLNEASQALTSRALEMAESCDYANLRESTARRAGAEYPPHSRSVHER
jgi:tetratricopeptide (TPR) repeat protein